MKKIFSSLYSMISSKGEIDHKVVLGVLCVLSLITALFLSPYMIKVFDPNLIQAVLWLAGLLVGGGVVEKFSPQIGNIMDKLKGIESKEENKNNLN